ncbi:TauD/TfdA family dioxygenase [Streptomyces sp. RKND-216]|uniref:TauD/TfdA family dioxygenase n=1 Tax=Streptomyces sp. RKND-216 TaxID=2562581 RepID=UPI00109DD2CF|nr:TauD/TfdA family dioxygenase [Streptomyces sp. RKND-216]THA25970.1 TauD/TfdA family dioxygenase [Streptomyces sp. RKND-216]
MSLRTSSRPLRAGRRRSLTDADAVAFRAVEPPALPVLATPTTAGVPLSVWAEAHASVVSEHLHRTGAVLFRGFDEGAAALRTVVERVAGDGALDYEDGATPRSALDQGVYSSTEYPADQTIEMHNEGCYSWKWPRVLGFACAVAPTTGGQTPLADSRAVLRRVPGDLAGRLEREGVRYVRNYTPGVGIAWQDALGCGEQGLADYAERTHTEVTRVGDDHLRTVALRPAVARHPESGAWVWFNQATSFHVSTVGEDLAEEMVRQLGHDRLPKTTEAGDGTRFTTDELTSIRAAFAAETTTFDWQRGDVLLVDNMLVAHGRAPFTGDREIRVAMAGGWDWSGPRTRRTRTENDGEAVR